MFYHRPMSKGTGLEGFPRGHFVVAFSDELAVGELKPLRYFGREFILFRDREGRPRVLSAHCPHLGAHLGRGGRVDEGEVRCPFHAWRFDGSGTCTEVPYARRIPRGARLDALETRELNGMITVRYDRDGVSPDYALPELPEWDDEAFSPWMYRTMRVKTHPREIVENVVDFAHFEPVHHTRAELFENEFQGYLAVQRSAGVGAPTHRFAGTSYSIEATYHGPGIQFSRFESRGIRVVFVNANTMIDERTLDLRFGLMVATGGEPRHHEGFLRHFIDDLQRGYAQDVEIWEHKVHREHPVLADGDGPIGELRRWYGQFYT
jgi:3-ketosteroid 9alpha-monooxygenase subunit A